VDLVVSTPTVALNPQQGAALPALRAGDVIEAQVLQAVGDAAKIAIGNTILEVLTQVALTPGATVKLAVSNTPQGLRLTLVGNGANGGNAGAGGATTTATAGQSPAEAARATSGTNATTGAASTSAGSTSRASQPPATIITTSAGAPQAAASADASVPARPSAAPAVTTSGNVSTAATTATNVAATAAAADPQAPTQTVAPNPILAATAALAAAVESSAARQGGLGPLFADAGVAAGLAAVPEPVRQAAERLLALLPSLDETLTADSVKQALDRSGLFLEARLSAEANGAPSDAAGSADDLKAALVVLRNAVKSWLASDMPISPALGGAVQGSTPDISALNGRNALMSLMAGMAGDDGPAQNGANAAAPNAAPHVAPSATAPPPPYRGAPTAGQPAAAPSISADTAPRDIGRVLLNETDAALARQTLMQAASLPDHASAMSSSSTMMHSDPTTGPRWLFEVPFATPQGAAVAQFEIARDGHKAPAEGQKVAWRARFSLDVEPIGAVHAQIALTGSRAAVTLWAERPETSTRLRDSAPQLADALRKAELETGDVLVRGGTPPRPREAVAAGRFLDRAS
jgi:hypothetical protein